MAKWQCNACGATYSDTMRDGSQYLHVCGPIPNPGFNLDASKGKRDERELLERADKRDENPTPGLSYYPAEKGYYTPDPDDVTKRIFHPGPVPIVSEGAGRTEVPDA